MFAVAFVDGIAFTDYVHSSLCRKELGRTSMSNSGQNIRSASDVLDKADSAKADASHFASLIESIAAHQDKQAFKRLFDHFAPRVKAYLLRLGADDGQAEEIAQETLLTLWRKAPLFDRRKAAPSTWIFTIARNRRIDRMRRQRFPELDPTDPVLVGEAPEQPDDQLSRADDGVAVRAALEKLPDEQRELVQLAFYKGWSHSQIASQTGLPLGTVKSRLRLAFVRLRNELEDRL